jgi:hypothetical protein
LYNAFKEEMEFVLEGKLYYLNKNENCELTINNNTYKYFINYDKKENNGYSKITVFFFFIPNLITCGPQNLKGKEKKI